MLSDNRAKLKNQIFIDVATQAEAECKFISPPYHPQSNITFDRFHNFLKACMSKHVLKSLEWHQVVPLACAAYNFLPNKHLKERPFFPMFSRDHIVPSNSLLKPTVIYLGIDENILALEALRNMYQLMMINLELPWKSEIFGQLQLT